MNRDLLDHFLSLVKELCQPMTADSGEKPREIIATIEDTFVNMQHLVNVMRPAQAAMDLKTLLDRQTKARQEMSEKLKDSVRKAWELIGEAATKLSEPSVELSEEAQVSVEELEKADLETQETEREHTPEKKTTPQHEQSDERSMDTVLAEIAQIVNDPTL